MSCHSIVPYFLHLSFLLLLLLLCDDSFGMSQASRSNRKNALVVQNGTHILRQGSELTFFESTTLSSTRRIVSSGSFRKRDVGWITSAWTYANITYYSATWKVPPAPTSDTGSNIIFFFNSLESHDFLDILQPVLQYNNIIPGWSLASWYGDPSGAYYHTTPVAVNEGDTIVGIISLEDNIWSVLGYVNGNLQTNITVSYSVLASQASAQFALEVYDVAQCEMYPSSNLLIASEIVLKSASGTVIPTWSPSIASNDCGAGLNYEPNGNVVHLLWLSDSSSSRNERATRNSLSEKSHYAPSRTRANINDL